MVILLYFTLLNSIVYAQQKFGASYMSFFDGPGITKGQHEITPNALGKPSDDGLIFNNNLTLKYNLKEDFALSLQLRTQVLTNNANQVDDFKNYRWQTPRVGISTTFFKTENSKLTGAFNTDLPYFFPEPFGGGFTARQRTTILTPGFFAQYTYLLPGSNWSIFSLVMPRFYFYEDRNKAEPQLSRAGYSPRLKNELNLSFNPSANYAFSDKLGFRLGTEIVYKKLIASGWNPFKATIRNSRPDSKLWVLSPIPIQTGLTYEFSKLFSLSTYIQGYPIGGQRIDRKGNKASFEDTLSVGAWISGTIF